MFENLFAKLGYGSAKVDLVLNGNSFTLGDTINGELHIEGGKVKQKINKIDVDFFLSIFKDGHEYRQQIQNFPFHHSFEIQPAERHSFPFTYALPMNLPISSSTVQFYFITRLDIASGVDSSDRDYIIIEPPIPLQRVLAAFNQLGFQEKHDSREFEGTAQEFELAPVSGPFSSQIREVEFFAMIDSSGVHLLLEVEKNTFIGEHEVKREVFISNEVLENPTELAHFLNQTLTEMLNNPHGFGSHTFHTFSGSSSGHGMSSHGMSKALGGAAVGAIGGFAAGILASQAIDQILDNDEDDDEGGLFASNDDDDEEIGGFFDDDDDDGGFFGNDDDEDDDGGFFGGDDIGDFFGDDEE